MALPLLRLPDGTTIREYEIERDFADVPPIAGLIATHIPLLSGVVRWSVTAGGMMSRWECHYRQMNESGPVYDSEPRLIGAKSV